MSAEEELRTWLEHLRWQHGPVCPHCRWQAPGAVTARQGVYRCRAAGCRRQFTVTLGTVLERTHQPLTIWWRAVEALTSTAKGLTIRRLQRQLEIPYRSTWCLVERLRKIAPSSSSPFTLAPLTSQEVFARLMARPHILPQERFDGLEKQERRIEARRNRLSKEPLPS